jgi:Arc/MetJ-type ribon-helix-helix transcriptional regulator
MKPVDGEAGEYSRAGQAWTHHASALTPWTARDNRIFERGRGMTISLTPKQEGILRKALQQGRFQSVDEALDEALRSLSTPADATARSAPLTPAEAAARIRELRKGNMLPEGMTIRAMIDEGRA